MHQAGARRFRHAAPAALWLLGAWAGAAGAGTLLDPTPQSEMRPLSTDRPDLTESPYTVDAGHLQVEADVIAYATDEAGGVTTEEYRWAQLNLKVGLHDRADVQLVVAPYVKAITEFARFGREEIVGSGDITVRVKLNLTGNDGNGLAVALLPFVVLPSGHQELSAGRPEVGIAVPAALALRGGFGLGVMGQVLDGDRTRAWLGTATLSRVFEEKLGLFVEIAAERVEPGRDAGAFWSTTFDAGFTYAVTPDLQLDGAALMGLTEEAPDWTLYTGITVRR